MNKKKLSQRISIFCTYPFVFLYICTTLFIFLNQPAYAQKDYAGDVYPVVKIKQGKFYVYYHNNIDRKGYKNIYYSDGKIIKYGDEVTGRELKFTEPELQGIYDDENERYLAQSFEKGKTRFEAYVKFDENGDPGKTLFLDYTIYGGTFTFSLGKPAIIFSAPIVSNFVLYKESLYIFTINFANELLLYKLNLTNRKIEYKKLDPRPGWNTHLSAAIIGDTILLAYHAPSFSVRDNRPGVSRIYNVFVYTNLIFGE
ncbi:MAG: hypothetical protein ABUK01_10855 [Leptospirales bacterium]